MNSLPQKSHSVDSLSNGGVTLSGVMVMVPKARWLGWLSCVHVVEITARFPFPSFALHLLYILHFWVETTMKKVTSSNQNENIQNPILILLM